MIDTGLTAVKQHHMTASENIILYPDPTTVFTDPALSVYFKPLLTANTEAGGQSRAIHLLSTDGLICEETLSFRYAENFCFGFSCNAGRYQFLGDLRVFREADLVPALHRLLLEDFEQKKAAYVKNKTTTGEYLEQLQPILKTEPAAAGFTDAEYYARSFYSYEFTKYYYQRFGVHRHVSVVTEGWAKNTDPFLLDGDDAGDILEEWLDGFEEKAAHQYRITAAMFAAGTERRRFVSLSSGLVLALLDPREEIVYMIECTS